MKLKAFIPSAPEIGRETIIVLCGALAAAFIIGQLPSVREWIRAQWGGAPTPSDISTEP
ncbi:hypothetical protein [Polaromonas sp.]|uniref:hypothetical protein n=1 Tax=Polaromonas sp. TaxID=1869339 RepID=UPI003CBCBAB1